MFANWWGRLFGKKPITSARARGNAGEDAAVRFLEKAGMRILDRNWRSSFGELDIVCREREVVVFVEVKAAGKASDFLPENRVNREKQNRIKRLATTYLKTKRWDVPIRYDIVTVVWKDDKPQIEHFVNAFI